MKHPKNSEWVKQTKCIHPMFPGGHPCGQPAMKDGPHGWLCSFHDALGVRPHRRFDLNPREAEVVEEV